jgi:hypothetical protein
MPKVSFLEALSLFGNRTTLANTDENNIKDNKKATAVNAPFIIAIPPM